MPKLLDLIDLVTEKHGSIELIVVDTLSRSIAGGNENAPETMTAVIENCDILRAHAEASMPLFTILESTDCRGHSSYALPRTQR